MESGAKGCEVLCHYVISQSSSLECDDRRSQFVLLLLPERQQKLRMQIVYNGLPKFLGRLLYAYLHPLLGADELSG